MHIRFKTLIGAALFTMGLVVVWGWLARIPLMVQFHEGFVPMVFNSAIGFCITGLAFALPGLLQRPLVTLQVVCGLLLVSLCGLSLTEIIFDVSLGIDMPELHTWISDGNVRPGRMAPNTAFGFILIGLSLIVVPQVNSRWQAQLARLLTFALLAVGLTGLVGYLLAPDLLYGWARSARMALHTGSGMVLAALALWFSWSQADWYRSRRYFDEAEKIGFISAAMLVVLTITAGLVGFVFQQAVVEKVLERELSQTYSQRAALFEAGIRARIEDSQRLAGQESILAALRTTEATADQARLALPDEIRAQGVSALSLMAADGREILHLGSFAAEPEFYVPMATGVLLWDADLRLRSSVAVRDGSSDLGTLMVEYSLADLHGQLYSAQGLGQTGEVVVCIDKSTALLCLPQPGSGALNRLNPYGRFGKPLPSKLAFTGESGVSQTVDYRGKNVMAAFGQLQPGLSMVTKVDTVELFADIREQLKIVAPLLILLAVAGSVLMGSQLRPLARRLLTSELDLFSEKERLRVTLSSIGDAVITTDTHGRVSYLNPIAESMTGWTTDEASGLPIAEIFDIICEKTGKPAFNPIHTVLKTQTMFELDADTTLIQRHTGKRFPIEDSAAPIRGIDGNIIGVVLVFHDVTETRKMAAEMTYQATHDSLTGLINRREFERRVELALQTGRTDHKEHSLLYLDLDQFKIVNDTCGHVAGDELLRQLTSVLQAKLRQTDTLARLGGDEFGVLLESCPTSATLKIAELLRKTVSEFNFVWKGKGFNVGVTIGLVSFSNDGITLTDVLQMADSACYVAKEKGRNRVQVYLPEAEEFASRHGEMGWVSRIRKALEENRFLLYAQQYRALGLTDTSVTHRELLIRMKDENGAIVPPMAFIPAAERYGLMPLLDRWVVSTAFSRYSALHLEGKQLLAINLSGTTLCDEAFPAFLHEQFAKHAVPPSSICFEITETAAIANLTQAIKLIHELRSLGCLFALDDFGSGMSSFGYLKHLPVNFLKIDGNFVRDMVDDPIDRAMVESINHIGHVMGIKTIAEFVETDQILDLLRGMGVDYAQGYRVQRPQPFLEEFVIN